MKDRVLLIEDDAAMRASLTQTLELEDITVIQADGLAQARRALRANFPGVVLSDIRMPKADGFDVLARVHEIDSDLPVIFLTGEANVPMAVRALQSGVYDFLEKPCSTESLLRVVHRALAHRRLALQARRLETTLEHSDAAAVHFPGSTTASTRLRRDLRQLAEANVNVHLHGEPGAGRRLAAHTLHFLSEDQDAAVSINYSNASGLEKATDPTALEGRTVILKNIDQAAPEDREHLTTSLATIAPRRLLTTAKSPMAELPEWQAIVSGVGDLAEIHVPSLRARQADLPLIFESLVRQSARSFEIDMPDIPNAKFDEITAADWSGNLPELRRAAKDLVLGRESNDASFAPGLTDQVAAFEKSLLIDALRKCDGVATRAAATLKLPRKTFYDKLARHGIDPKSAKPKGSGKE